MNEHLSDSDSKNPALRSLQRWNLCIQLLHCGTHYITKVYLIGSVSLACTLYLDARIMRGVPND